MLALMPAEAPVVEDNESPVTECDGNGAVKCEGEWEAAGQYYEKKTERGARYAVRSRLSLR